MLSTPSFRGLNNVRLFIHILLGVVFWSTCSVGSLSAQGNSLSVEDAIRRALENNYNVRIARNSERISANSNTLGNAGFLPTISTSGSVTYSSNNTRQEFFSGDSREGQGAGNTNARFGVAMNWTAFDGFRMFAVRDRLEFQEQRSQMFTQRTMHDLATQVQSAYYGLVRIQQQIDIINRSITLNQSLRDLAQGRLRLGAGTELAVLQSSNQVNADSAALLNLQDQLAQSKIAFNRLLGQSPDSLFNVGTTIPQIVLPTLEELTQRAIAENYDVKLLKLDERIALTQIKEARSDLFPSLSLNAGYNFNYSRAEVGFLLSNRTYGPTIGLTANYDIFQGRNLKKDIANAELFVENIKLDQQNLEADLEADLAQLFQDYQAAQRLEELEIRNLQIAERNTNLARRLYETGRSTDFEVREAVLAEIRTRDRLSEVLFRKKIAEIALKGLAGIPLFGLN